MPEIDEIRQRRMQELMQQQLQQQMQQKEIEAQIKLIIHKILTPKARERLGNIRVARPDFARQVEILLIQLYQSGRLPKQVTDGDLKEILKKLKSEKKETKISVR